MRELLGRREATHGRYVETSSVASAIRDLIHEAPSYARMSPGKRIAADEIALKLGRIVCGDPDFRDHWLDIAGYAEKAVEGR